MSPFLAFFDAVHAIEGGPRCETDRRRRPVSATLDGVVVDSTPGLLQLCVLGGMFSPVRGYRLTGPNVDNLQTAKAYNRHDARVRLRGGLSRPFASELPFPETPFPAWLELAEHHNRSDAFLASLASVFPAAAIEETRYALDCVQFGTNGTDTVLAATDGRRYHLASPTMDGHRLAKLYGDRANRKEWEATATLNLPRGVAAMLLRFRKAEAVTLAWDASNWRAEVTLGGGWQFVVWGEHNGARFPSPDGLFVNPCEQWAAQDARAVSRRIRALAKVNETMQAVQLRHDIGGPFKIRPLDDDDGAPWETLDGAVAVGGTEVCPRIFCGEYLADAIDACAPEYMPAIVNGPTDDYPSLVIGKRSACAVMPISPK